MARRVTKAEIAAMKRVKKWLSRQGYMTLFKAKEVVDVYRNGDLRGGPVLTGFGDFWIEALHDAAQKIAERDGVELPEKILRDMERRYE